MFFFHISGNLFYLLKFIKLNMYVYYLFLLNLTFIHVFY